MIERILLDDFRMNAIARIVAGMNYCGGVFLKLGRSLISPFEYFWGI
jgi:hypothetical protein